MAHRVNVMLDEDAWQVVRALPRGQRSRFISRAVISTAALDRRRKAASQLAVLRGRMPPSQRPAEELVQELRDNA